MALFRQEVHNGDQLSTEETVESTELAVKIEKKRPFWDRWHGTLLVCAINVAAVFFQKWYYDTAVLTTVNIALLLAVLWPCALVDGMEFRIPNRILLVGLLARCVTLGVALVMEPQEIGYILLQCGVAAIALLIVSLFCRLLAANSIGYGDVKLLMLMGFFLGTAGIWGAMLFSMLVAFVYSVYLLLTKKADRKTEIAFAPFLLIGTIAAAVLTNF
jgi:leader peptidase (prepilin peptidase)/N-methyltransferase